jgi:hypothetical protein
MSPKNLSNILETLNLLCQAENINVTVDQMKTALQSSTDNLIESNNPNLKLLYTPSLLSMVNRYIVLFALKEVGKIEESFTRETKSVEFLEEQKVNKAERIMDMSEEYKFSQMEQKKDNSLTPRNSI